MEMVTVCDEIIAVARMIFRGIPVDRDHLALDVIHEVGSGGHYLGTDHTARLFRTNHFLARLLDRHNYDKWQQLGARSLEDAANAKVLEILATHHPTPIPEAAQETIDSVLARAAKRG